MYVPHYEVPLIQGADWTPTLHWYAGGPFMAALEEIDPGYPTKIKVTSHGLPQVSATPVIISGVEGMEILNSKDLAILHASYVDDDHFSLPASTIGREWVIGTGELTYFQPTDISGMTFRAKLRSRVHNGEVLAEMTTANGGIITVEEDASIQLFLSSVDTAALSFTRGYVDVEAVTAGSPDIVQRVFSLSVDLIRESTR